MSKQFSNISVNDFKKYLSGKMSSAEKKAFEESIEQDEFAKEAFNGFMAIENNKNALNFIEKSIAASSKKIGLPEIETKNPSISIYKSLSIAAILVLIFGGLWMTYSLLNKTETIAENKQNETPIEDYIDKNEENQEVDSVINELEIEDKIFETPSEESVKEKKDITQRGDAPLKSDALEDYTEDIEVVQEPKTNKVATSSEIDKSNYGLSTTKNLIRSQPSPATQDAEAIEEISVSNYDKAYEFFQSGNLKEAAKLFETSLKENIRVTESMYFLGLSNYYLQDYNKAINNFDAVIQSSNQNLKYNAMWYKADILMKKGNRKAAKKLLIDVANSESIFKTKAKELIENL